MSDTAAVALTQQYLNDFMLTAQDNASRLEPFVTSGEATGEKTAKNLFGKTTPVERTARNQDTPITPTPITRRWSITRHYMVADLFDTFDEVRTTINDPKMGYAESQSAAMGRQTDTLLIAGMSGTAVTGQTGSGTQALPSGQKVAVNSHSYDEDHPTYTGNAGLSWYKVMEAVALLEGAYGGAVSGNIHGYYFAKEKNTLMANARASSRDYIRDQVAPFLTGQIPTFLGVQWHLLSDDLVTVDGSSNRLVHLWVPKAVRIDVSKGLNLSIDKRLDKAMAWQIFTEWMKGVSRDVDEGVAQIACHPTTLFATS